MTQKTLQKIGLLADTPAKETRMFGGRKIRTLCFLGLGLLAAACTSEETSSCSAILFDTLPVADASGIYGYTPLGNLDPARLEVFPAGKVYVAPIADDPMASPPTYFEFDVVSPGNLNLMAITSKHYTATDHTEYKLFFKACSSVRAYVENLTSLSPELLDKITDKTPNWENSDECIANTDAFGDFDECTHRLPRTAIRSGFALGSAGRYHGMAFGVYDRAVDVAYTTPRYYRQSLLAITDLIGIDVTTYDQVEALVPTYSDPSHASCPWNYYTQDPEATNYPAVHLVDFEGNDLGDWDGTNCGTFVYDGAAAAGRGNWFLKELIDEVAVADGVELFGADQYGVALVNDRIHKNTGGTRNYPVFSIGQELPIVGGALTEMDPGRYEFTVAPAGTTNRNFGSLSVGVDYCYENLTRLDGSTTFAGVLRLQLDEAQVMRIEAFGGAGDTCASTSLDTDALQYVR